jgi:hypothetical protein
MLVTAYDQSHVKQCAENLIFNEEKQACVEPNSKEEIECLLISSLVNQENLSELLNDITRQQSDDETSPTTTVITTTANSSANPLTSTTTTKLVKKSLTFKEAKSRLTQMYKSKAEKNSDEDDELFLEMLKSLADADDEEGEESADEQDVETTKAMTTKPGGRRSKQERMRLVKSKKAMVRKQTAPVVTTMSPGRARLVSSAAASKYKGMCQVTNWSQFRTGRGRFTFDMIDVDLCKYIIFASIAVIESEAEADYEDDDEEAAEAEYMLKPVQHNDFGRF